MTLQLNKQTAHYKVFEGAPVRTFPQIVAEGRDILSARELMEQRVSSGLSDWDNHWFDLGDAFAYSADGDHFKIVHDAQELRQLGSKSNIRNGMLILPEGAYKTLPGQEYSKRDIGSILNRGLKQREAHKHPLLLDFADGNQELLGAFVEDQFKKMRDQFDYKEGMGVYVADSNVDGMRALYVDGLGSGSDFGGRGGLGGGGGRAVGVAPEALRASDASTDGEALQTHSLEERVRAALAAGRSFEYHGTIYAPIRNDSGVRLE